MTEDLPNLKDVPECSCQIRSHSHKEKYVEVLNARLKHAEEQMKQDGLSAPLYHYWRGQVTQKVVVPSSCPHCGFRGEY